MSGIEVIGLISGVLTVLDTINKLRHTIEDVHGLNPTLRQAADRLPLVHEILKATQASLEISGADDMTCSSIQQVLQSCSNKAQSLRHILQTIAVGASGCPSICRKYAHAIRGLRKRQQAEELMKGILDDVYLLVGNSIMRTSSQHQTIETSKSKSACSSIMECSSPASDIKNIKNEFNNFSGIQSNNFYGKQCIAETMNFC